MGSNRVSALYTLRRLAGALAPLWRAVALSVLLGLLTIASSVGLMATSAWLISKAALQPSIAELGVSVAAVRFFGIARGVFRYLERLVSHDTTFRLLAEWRVRFYRAVEPLAPARLVDARSGDLLGRVVADVDALQEVYLRAIAPPLVAVLVAVVMTWLFGAFDPLVALALLAFMVIGGIGLPLLAWRNGQGSGQALVDTRAQLHAALVDEIQGMADRLIYVRPDPTQFPARSPGPLASEQPPVQQPALGIANLRHLTAAHTARERSFARLDGLQKALGVLAVNGAALAVLAVAIPRVDGVYLATLALATIAAFEAITPLAQAATYLGGGLAAARRLFEVIDQKPAIAENVQPSPAPCDYGIEFDRVTFRYSPAARPALDQFSLSVQSGQRVAVFGASGSGKSTLINLLLRFWEYECGAIRLGGHDLRDYAPTEVRAMIGVMTQRTYLFNTSILENIRLARPEASDEDVMRAAQRAQVHDFIAQLQDGYATDVGEDGARLSGGERQRIALARVLLKDAPIVILDEPTANLDALTEQLVWQSIFETTAGRTVLILSHRLPPAEQVDHVMQLG